jgi:site-specific recombinase XerD
MKQALAHSSSAPSACALRGRRLGPHHFAYLRATAEGLDRQACAQRFLGLEHGHERRRAHTLLVDQVRALARRAGERAWRLVGLTIRSAPGAAPGSAERPALQAFIEANDRDGWSEDEQRELYAAAHPRDRRAARRERLRQRQVELRRRLEGMAAQAPRPSDLVSDWFDEVSARKLISAGHTTLQDLARTIAAGGRWYRTMPGVGQTKAGRLCAHLLTLIPAALPPERPFFALQAIQNQRSAVAPALTCPTAVKRSGSLLEANTDMAAVQAWIRSRCSSGATVKSYGREARRLLLWLQVERGGRGLADMTVEDCLAYQAFLQHIPPGWISRHRLAPGEPGWAPFKGPLTAASQGQAVRILGGLFAWLTASRYLGGDPWLLVNNDTVRADPLTQVLDTKSISDGALLQIQRFLEAQAPCPSVHRIRFVVAFMQSVGLRSSELVNARLGDFSRQPEGWTLRVVGKGAKTRTVFVPRPAFEALQIYLDHRGIGGIETAPPSAPLLASAEDPMAPVGYQALYTTVKLWLAKAIEASELSSRERSELAGATTHWLRHTFGTKAVAREVPFDVIQQQLGHASINTTMSIYSRAPLKRRAEELAKAFR